MLRIWKGKELEGFEQGKETLFISGNEVLNYDFITDIILKEHADRIYLGAGRLDYCGFLYNAEELKFIDFCKINNIQIVIETDPTGIQRLTNYFAVATIIVSIRSYYLDFKQLSNLYLKFDNYKDVRIYDNGGYVDTNLDKLQESGLYKDTDQLIYEEE